MSDLTQLPLAAKRMSLAGSADSMNRSVLRQMIDMVSRPGILSFAGGLPAPELFPTQAYMQPMAHVLATDARALQYNPPLAQLKSHVVHLMVKRGVNCTDEQVLLTTGAQQGLDILTRLLLNPGGEVMLEEVVYTGVQQVISPLRPRAVTIPTDLQNGIDANAIEAR
jgi:2-aminoadipate transaminase